MEAAAGRDVGGVGVALAQADIRDALAGLGREHGGQQGPCVGVARAAEQRIGFRLFDDAAEIHHRDLRRDVLDHRQIVADEQVGQAKFPAQFGQQVQNLRLHRYIQRAGRFVADHDARTQHQGAGDRHALALPAGQLRRLAPRHFRRQADACEHLHHPVAHLRARHIALRGKWQGNDLLHRAARIERGERVLEHRLDQPRPLPPVHAVQAPSVDTHLAGTCRQQAEDHACEGGLAAAGLADDAEHLAGRQRERHAVHGPDRPCGREHAATAAEFAADIHDLDGGRRWAHVQSAGRTQR